MAGPATLWSFEGRWTLERQIADRLGRDATLTGAASFRRSGARLIYEESGDLRVDGQPGPIRATRRYIWEARESWIAISFDDGRPFHAFPAGVDRPEATHLCSPDRYRVDYDFGAWPAWQAVWRVEGPRKDYVMTSHYARAA